MHCKLLQRAPANGMHRLLPSMHSNVLSAKPCLEETTSRPGLWGDNSCMGAQYVYTGKDNSL